VTRLLHIQASPRGARSRSDAVAQRYLAGLPDIEVELLDLWAADLPPFDGAVIDARYALIEGRDVPSHARADWARIEAMVAHFLSFDRWLFGVPMWNFGVPYRLKQYADCITQPGLAFRVSADGEVEGQAKGSAVLLCAGALDTRPDGALAGLDFQGRWLEAWLGFIGVTAVSTLRIQPTYGSSDIVAAAMARAFHDADALAAQHRAA
jgi:FMN-dependent NADH-azoreductase